MVSGLDIEKAEKIGLDLRNLSSDWLAESMVLGDSQWFAGLSEYRQRSVVLVLLFLKYIGIRKKKEKEKEEEKGGAFLMYAIIEACGRQYKVEEKMVVFFEKLEEEEGKKRGEERKRQGRRYGNGSGNVYPAFQKICQCKNVGV